MPATAIYTLTIFTSAFLLFLIQPMISRLLLPHLGGSPAVWNTAMLFFQSVLLLGYVYAHATARLLDARRQALLHVALVALALAWLPIAARTDLGFASALHPVAWVMAALLLSVGAPFFILATSAPLLQYWLSNTDHRDAQDPYFLYSASNIGSLLALLLYPFVIEPAFTLPQQTWLWSALFIAFAALIAGCVIYGRRHYRPALQVAAAAGDKPALQQKLYWIALSFCPSSLLLGVTTYITTDLASMPLFWVIPLALYLLTFVFAFARTPLLVDRALGAQVLLAPLTALVMLFDLKATASLLLLHLLTFFVLAMGCHGVLARCKPHPRHLTEYFVWISFGGMLGGVFNALLAPRLFSEPFEYPLIFLLTLLLRPQTAADTPRRRALDYAVPAALILAILLVFRLIAPHMPSDPLLGNAVANHIVPLLLYIPLAAAALLSQRRPLRFALAIFTLFLGVPVGKTLGRDQESPGKLLYVERNFFGVNRLFEWAPSRSLVLMHGTTLHGMQPLEPSKRLSLTAYYSVMAGIYDHLAPGIKSYPAAVIGLGAGTLACVGAKGQEFDFYEIDPAVAGIARNPEFFTYLRDCPPRSRVILGDGRLEIEKAAPGRYGLIMVDAFSSDAIPAHLLTREALAVYRGKLAEGGVMAFHISNRHLNLKPLMAALARDAGMAALVKEDRKTGEAAFVTSAVWVAMARRAEDLHGLEKADAAWKTLEDSGNVSVWTDHYSNIFQALF